MNKIYEVYFSEDSKEINSLGAWLEESDAIEHLDEVREIYPHYGINNFQIRAVNLNTKEKNKNE